MITLLHSSVVLPKYIPQPIGDWALCQNVEEKQVTRASGIVLPQTESREDLAVVIATGPGVMTASGKYAPFLIKPGDVVRTTRKKGRTAYIDIDVKLEGVDDEAQTSYNYYQWNEIIAVEYHSQSLAKKIAEVQKKYSIVVSEAEEDEIMARQKTLIEANKAAEAKARVVNLEASKKRRDFRERLFQEQTGE